MEAKDSKKGFKKSYDRGAYVKPDRYLMDSFLVRREASLLLLAMKAFRKRVIVFFNEKRQCERMGSLFAMFGLKAVQVHGNLSQVERMEAVEAF